MAKTEKKTTGGRTRKTAKKASKKAVKSSLVRAVDIDFTRK